MTTISIALATYNGERFLREQLQSLAKQTRLPDELVVADDGSTDGTLDIVRDFASVSPFKTTVLPSEGRLGYRANFMHCAQHCTGDLIAFCDQDDVWNPEKLKFVENSIQPSTLLLQHDFHVIDADGNIVPGSMNEIGISSSDRWAPVLGLVQVFHRKLLAFWPLWQHSVDQNAPSERMAHDQWVYFLAISFQRVQLLNIPLLNYRQHDHNTCGIARQKTHHNELQPKAILKDIITGKPQSRRVKRTLILDGLTRYRPAAESRTAIVHEMYLQSGEDGSRKNLEYEIKFYKDFASYCQHRLSSYNVSSGYELVASLLTAKSDYIARGTRGLKDILLDLALNA